MRTFNRIFLATLLFSLPASQVVVAWPWDRDATQQPTRPVHELSTYDFFHNPRSRFYDPNSPFYERAFTYVMFSNARPARATRYGFIVGSAGWLGYSFYQLYKAQQALNNAVRSQQSDFSDALRALNRVAPDTNDEQSRSDQPTGTAPAASAAQDEQSRSDQPTGNAPAASAAQNEGSIEAYLRKALSVSDTSDTHELGATFEDMPLSAQARRVVNEKLNVIKNTPKESSMYAISEGYLGNVASLPWGKETQDNLDLEQVGRKLDEAMYGMHEVKQAILEFLAVRKAKPNDGGKILCLVGPPGVGKTAITKAIANALGRNYARVSLGGVHTEGDIRGNPIVHIGAAMGCIIKALKTADSINPVIGLDEIDKLGASMSQGDPNAALLEALDPEQNYAFVDHYLEFAFDLSKVLFIATANNERAIPAALRNRMEIIKIPGYTRAERIHITQDFVVPRQQEDVATECEGFELSPEVVTVLVKHLKDPGIRSIQFAVEALFAKHCLSCYRHGHPLWITPQNVVKLLQRRREPGTTDDSDDDRSFRCC